MYFTILPHFLNDTAVLNMEILDLELVHLDLLRDDKVGFNIAVNFLPATFCV